jgi:hypothetical protein
MKAAAERPDHTSSSTDHPGPDRQVTDRQMTDRHVLDYRTLESVRLVFGEIYADH